MKKYGYYKEKLTKIQREIGPTMISIKPYKNRKSFIISKINPNWKWKKSKSKINISKLKS